MPALFIALIVADIPSDATYYSSWDKVGTVAVCVMMLGVLVLLLRAAIKRVDAISDKHMQFVQSQTAVLTNMTASNDKLKDSAESMHRRIDGILSCRKFGCPMKQFLASEDEGKPP